MKSDPMKLNRIFSLVILLCSISGPVISQDAQLNPVLIGGVCEGCEAVYSYGNKTLTAIDTLPGYQKYQPKIKISGTIYKSDGVTPASDVILFVHQANQEGVYPTHGNEDGWASIYGYIHGWVKTGTDGKYTIYTFRPGSYSNTPAHIHPIIMEPNGKHYWLQSYRFSDDPLLKVANRNIKNPRGGSDGILILERTNGHWVGQRDFILGKNIPGYE
jgi:protocatechuate 3,4-dioxygenase beta subunit